MSTTNKIRGIDLVFPLMGGIILLFILAPIVSMFIHTRIPELSMALSDQSVTSSIWLTLWVSMAATLLFAVFAIPLAWFLARHQFLLKNLVTGIIDLPVVIPHSAAGIALLTMIVPGSALGSLAGWAGIGLVGTKIAIGLAMAFVSLPFLINAARNGFENVPVRLEKAAMSLGASPLRVFFTISVPLAGRSILSGLVMMFARGMSEFGAVVIVAYHPMVTPVLIFERFTSFGLQWARPVAVIFIVVCLVAFIVIKSLTRRNHV